LENLAWKRPVVFIYRIALVGNGKTVRKQWGNFHIFRSGICPVAWEFAERDVMRSNSLDGLSLRLVLSLPQFSTVTPIKGLEPPKFELIDNEESKIRVILFQKMMTDSKANKEIHDGQMTKFNEDEEDQILEAYIPDVDLVIVDKKTKSKCVFNCHRWILVLGSPYFFKQLHQRRLSLNSKSNGIEYCEKEPVIIEFDDIDAETMEIILQHIYTRCLPNFHGYRDYRPMADDEIIIKTASAATKFELELLRCYSLSILLFGDNDDDGRFKQLQMAKKWELNALEKVCAEQLATFVIEIDNPLPNWFDHIFKLALGKIWTMDKIRPIQQYDRYAWRKLLKMDFKPPMSDSEMTSLWENF